MKVDAEAGDGRLFKLRVPAHANRLKLVRAAVAEAAALCGCNPTCAGDVVLAVDEACQNVVRHAYGTDASGDMVVELSRAGDRLEIMLVDFAPPVDPTRIKSRDLTELRPGGLGTHFIRAIMDEAEFCDPPNGAGNCLRMSKRIE